MTTYSEPVAVLPVFNPADFNTVLTTPATNVEINWQTELDAEAAEVASKKAYLTALFDPLQNVVNGFVKPAAGQWDSNTQANWIIQHPDGGAMIVDAGWYIVTVCAGVNYNRQPDGPDYTYATEPSWFGMIVGVANPQYNYLTYNDITSWGIALNGTFIVQKTEPGNLVVSVGLNTKNPFNMVLNLPQTTKYPTFTVIKVK